MAIVMISEFGPENFPPRAGPDRPGHTWRPTDVTSFRGLWYGGADILAACWKKKGFHGWVEVGEQRDIGLFIWTANSEVDRRFLRQFPELAHNISIDAA